MFHEDDVAVPDAEADVVLDVVEEHAAQGRDRDVLRRDAAGRSRLHRGWRAPFVVEDVAEQRIFVGPFRLHVQAPFLLLLLYHMSWRIVRSGRCELTLSPGGRWPGRAAGICFAAR